MKVLLAAVNAKYIHSNLAVHSLKAYARTYTEEIEVAEYTINQTFDAILQDIYRRKPDLLGISCYLWNIEYVGQLLRELPKILPDTKIWLGGPEVSYDAKAVLEQYPKVEGVMCGEGEETFAELLRVYHEEKGALCSGVKRDELFSDIPGIAYRNKDKAVIQNDFRPVIDLSTIPFVYDHIEDFENRIIYYESSRGCPFSCSYCLSSIDKCLRFREIELVKKELQFFIDKKVPQVKFVDRTFNCRHDHAMAIWTYIHEHDNGITNFHFEVSADLLNEKEIALINRMRPGLIQLEIGVQSANEITIREINRTMKIDILSTIVDKIKKGNNVHQHLDLIAGLPYEGYESFGKSFDRVYKMNPEQLQLGFLKVLKGSVMHDRAQEYGIVYQDRAPYEVLSTKWLTYAEVIRLKQIEEMVEVYYNSGQFCCTMAALEQEFASPFCMYECLAAYYDEKNAFAVSHSRIGRYEILYDFIVKSTHNRRERPVHGHRGGSRGRFYYRITTFEGRPWDARDPYKTTFMALKHEIRLSIWRKQKETPGVEKAPGVSSPQRKESGRSGRDDGELRFWVRPGHPYKAVTSISQAEALAHGLTHLHHLVFAAVLARELDWCAALQDAREDARPWGVVGIGLRSDVWVEVRRDDHRPAVLVT